MAAALHPESGPQEWWGAHGHLLCSLPLGSCVCLVPGDTRGPPVTSPTPAVVYLSSCPNRGPQASEPNPPLQGPGSRRIPGAAVGAWTCRVCMAAQEPTGWSARCSRVPVKQSLRCEKLSAGQEFPGGPVVRAQHSPCQVLGSIPGRKLGSHDPHSATRKEKSAARLHSQGIFKVISKHKEPRVLLFLSL